MKTKEQIEEINRKRKEAMDMLRKVQTIFSETGCSLGAGTIVDCIDTLKQDGCDEY
jgi:hypothetical protein